MTAANRTQRAMWTACRDAARDNVAAAFENVDPDLVASVADDLRSRDQIYVAGAHASNFIARYLYFVAGMASPSFRPVTLESGTFVDEVFDLSPTDALICVSPTPSARGLLHLADVARERRALVIAITDRRTSPLATLAYLCGAQRVLVAPRDSPSFFESHVGFLAIIETLVGFLAQAAGVDAAQRIDRIRADRSELEQLRHDRTTLV